MELETAYQFGMVLLAFTGTLYYLIEVYSRVDISISLSD